MHDMPEDLYKSLKLKAKMEHRSLAQQAVILLGEALTARGRDSFRRIEALRKMRLHKVQTKSKDISIIDMIHEDRIR